jgi:hypothetical protein
MSYSRLEYETERAAEEMYGPVQGACREVLATMLTLRSELTGNGVEHKSGDLVELTKLVFTQAWPVRR